MLRPLHLRGIAPGNPLTGGLVNPKIDLGSECYREHKTSCITVNGNPDVVVAYPVDTIPTELFHINHKKPQCIMTDGRMVPPFLGLNISKSLFFTEIIFP
jgi:hypothetical protein